MKRWTSDLLKQVIRRLNADHIHNPKAQHDAATMRRIVATRNALAAIVGRLDADQRETP